MADVILSAFADESAISKTAVEQLAVMAGLGLSHYSVRFVDMGAGVRNVMKLEPDEVGRLVELNHRYGLAVASVGSPIGKIKLLDVDDGTANAFIPFDTYLEREVPHAISLCHRFGTKLLRGFSFYQPKGQAPEPHLPLAIDRIGRITERCAREGVVFGLELEANLIGCTGGLLATIADAINHPNLTLVFDGGNLACQNISATETLAEYRKMKHRLGWIHVKDYRIEPGLVWHGHVDEERLKNFVPVGHGDGGYPEVFAELKRYLPELSARMKALGVPGVFVDLEPHVRGGGQFGGYSGPDGMGVSLRALTGLLDKVGLSYHLRDAESLRG
jgi:sugar phosphate isomerase/epimerase